MISSNSFTTKAQQFECNGIEVHTFPFRKILLAHDLLGLRATIEALKKLIGSFQPNCLHVHGFYEVESFYQSRIAEAFGLPLFLTLHGLMEQKSYQTANCRRLWSLAYKISAVSQQMKKEAEQFGLSDERLSVIYNGLPLPNQPMKPLPTRFQIAMGGRLSEEKCFDQALRALSLLDLPISMTLYGDGDQRDALLKLRQQLKLESKVSMPGVLTHPEVLEAIDSASLVLIPSRYESFSLAALEAALRGRPVIASAVGGLREVVIHEKTGLLVPPIRPKALASAIDHCYQNPLQMEAMGLQARKWAERYFCLERIGHLYLDWYLS